MPYTITSLLRQVYISWESICHCYIPVYFNHLQSLKTTVWNSTDLIKKGNLQYQEMERGNDEKRRRDRSGEEKEDDRKRMVARKLRVISFVPLPLPACFIIITTHYATQNGQFMPLHSLCIMSFFCILFPVSQSVCFLRKKRSYQAYKVSWRRKRLYKYRKCS